MPYFCMVKWMKLPAHADGGHRVTLAPSGESLRSASGIATVNLISEKVNILALRNTVTYRPRISRMVAHGYSSHSLLLLDA